MTGSHLSKYSFDAGRGRPVTLTEGELGTAFGRRRVRRTKRGGGDISKNKSRKNAIKGKGTNRTELRGNSRTESYER